MKKGISSGGKKVSPKLIIFFSVFSFALGMLFTTRVWTPPDSDGPIMLMRQRQQEQEGEGEEEEEDAHFVSNSRNGPDDDHDCTTTKINNEFLGEVHNTNEAIQYARSLDNSVAELRVELPATQGSSSKVGHDMNTFSDKSEPRKKAFMVIGINTAFSSRKRRDSIRETWMPRGEKLFQLEQEKGIVVRFMIGHSATSNSILDRAIDSEDAQHKDFFRLEHVEGYHELTAKTKTFFSTAVSEWDAEFYVKVDDDVHVNLGMLAATLASHRSKPRIYIGCMKSGPVLSQKNVKYHEPEYWKFGEEGNKYFRHATGQIYAISKDLANYISINQPILHKYANEDVSLGAWFIGLDVEHINDHNMCCGTPPDCEWKAQAGKACVASFDWSCSGICKSVERIQGVHQKCGEDAAAIWNVTL